MFSREKLSLNSIINLTILSSGACLALCLYLLGPGYSNFSAPVFDAPSLVTAR